MYYLRQCRRTENGAISISIQMLCCLSVSPRFCARDCEISKGTSGSLQRRISPAIHVPPIFPFPLPFVTGQVQVGQRIGNLRSSRRAVTCPRRHSRQKACPQESTRAIKFAGISSIQIGHSNEPCADSTSSLRCAGGAPPPSSNARCRRTARDPLSVCFGVVA